MEIVEEELVGEGGFALTRLPDEEMDAEGKFEPGLEQERGVLGVAPIIPTGLVTASSIFSCRTLKGL